MKKIRFILETGCNHQGDLSIAKDMIDKAVELKVWGIKFQKRDLEAIPENVKSIKRNIDSSFGKTYYEHRKVLEFDIHEIGTLKNYAEYRGLNFICSAFDMKSMIELAEMGCKYIKLPSQLYTSIPLKNQLIALREKHNFEIMVSTGMHKSEEIFTNTWIEYADIIFHCISTYPACITEMNLKTIQELNKIRKNIGYSSHENEGYGIKFAIFAGAEYIERHFTLNKEWKGSDHGTVSSDPDEIKRIISDIEWVEKIIGTQDRLCKLKERKIRKVYRGINTDVE